MSIEKYLEMRRYFNDLLTFFCRERVVERGRIELEIEVAMGPETRWYGHPYRWSGR